MPTTDMKVKSGKKYPVKYRVVGSLSELTREEVEALALKQLRGSARAFCLQKLNEAEPAIVVNRTMRDNMVAAGLANEETANAFFGSMNMVLDIPDTFEIPVADLLPGESSRGKKASDIFAFESEEESDDEAEA